MSDTAKRLEWLDYAKGICIVAVVTMYTTRHVHDTLGSAGWMQWWSDFAAPFRMPDFFFISGLLLARVIDRPWRAYVDKKVVHYLYFFALWTVLYFLAKVAVDDVGDTPAAAAHTLFRMAIVDPFAMLWFIEMLPLYFVLTRLTRRVPWWLMLPLAALWSLVPMHTEWLQFNRTGERYVFFYGGYLFAQQTFRYARWVQTHPRGACGALLAWALFNGACVFGGAYRHVPGLHLVLGFLGTAAVIGVAALLDARHWLPWLRVAGHRSLPIYLGFFLPMAALLAGYPQLGIEIDLGLLALLLGMASIGIALGAFRLALHTPLRLLYERPGWAYVRDPAAVRRPLTPPRRRLG